MTRLDIQVEDTQSVLSIDPASISPIVHSVLELEKASCDEVIIHFIEEAELCAVHKQFFNDPSPTDCISIQVDGPDESPRFLGEVFISPKAAIDYLKENEGELYEELTLYLVHGLLHLLDYDDLEDEDRKKMRLAEKRQMDYLKMNHLLLKK